MWMIIAVVAVVLVAGVNFIIERSSLSKSMKSVARIAVLLIALSLSYYWVRIA
jgi:hypothetical protein